MKCNVCSKELTRDSETIIGIQIKGEGSNLEESFAPYPVAEYNICFGCWLKSLGVKEE